MSAIPTDLLAAATAIGKARQVCVLTGAGISAESGVPTFRDAQTGLWAKFRPEDLATPEAFARDPRRIWDWYEWRRELVRGVEPNAGHLALVQLAARVPKLTLVTQNVDGLHQRAGSTGVIEYHGNILRDRCCAEGTLAERSTRSVTGLPECARCGALLRPDVVWFGEAIPPRALVAADAGSGCLRRLHVDRHRVGRLSGCGACRECPAVRRDRDRNQHRTDCAHAARGFHVARSVRRRIAAVVAVAARLTGRAACTC